MSKFLKDFNKFAKDLPLHSSAVLGTQKNEVPIFFSADSNEVINQGIGLELETWYDPVVSPELKKFFIENEIVGPIASGKVNRFNPDGLPLKLEAVGIAGEAPTIYRRVIIANLSPLIYKEPVIDHTINKGTGSPEFQFHPVDLSALPIVKVELYRILYYLKKAGFQFNLPDTSIHLHASSTMLGGTKDAVELTLSNLLWFLWEAKEFMPIFCGRAGTGITLTELRSHLGDPLNIYNEHELFSRFMATKMKAVELFQDTGSWVEGAIPGRLKDTKGVFNFILNGEHGTLENRWFGSSDNVDEIMSYYEFYFALIEFCKQNRVLSAKTKVLENFAIFCDDPKYPHLVEKLKTIPMTAPHVKGEYLYLETSLFEKEILAWDYSFLPDNVKYQAPEVAETTPFSPLVNQGDIEPVAATPTTKTYEMSSSFTGKPIEVGSEVPVVFQISDCNFGVAYIDRAEEKYVRDLLLMRECVHASTDIDDFECSFLGQDILVPDFYDNDGEYIPFNRTVFVNEEAFVDRDNVSDYLEDNELSDDDCVDLEQELKETIAQKTFHHMYYDHKNFVSHLQNLINSYSDLFGDIHPENQVAFIKAMGAIVIEESLIPKPF